MKREEPLRLNLVCTYRKSPRGRVHVWENSTEIDRSKKEYYSSHGMRKVMFLYNYTNQMRSAIELSKKNNNISQSTVDGINDVLDELSDEATNQLKEKELLELIEKGKKMMQNVKVGANGCVICWTWKNKLMPSSEMEFSVFHFQIISVDWHLNSCYIHEEERNYLGHTFRLTRFNDLE